jgi:hypothetical protein
MYTCQPHARHFWVRLALALGIVLAVTAAHGSGQSGQSAASSRKSAPAVLTGKWKLNREESEDPQEKLRTAIQDRDQNTTMGRHGGMGGGIGMGIPGIGGIGGGGMGGPGGGMGGPGGGMGRGSGSSSAEQQAHLRNLVQPADQLTVDQKGPEIDMTDRENHVRALFTDGRKLEKPKKDSSQTQVKATWQGETLTTEEKGPSGEKVSHTYELSSEGKAQLIDTLTVESKRLNTPIIIRSVYDKAE